MASGMQWGRATRSSVSKDPNEPETSYNQNIENPTEDNDKMMLLVLQVTRKAQDQAMNPMTAASEPA